jgi:hypothetical protein
MSRSISCSQNNVAAVSTGPVKRVGVLGTLVCDRLWTYDAVLDGDPPFQDWGGICYTFISMAAALPEGWEVVPIVKVGFDVQEEAIAFLSDIPRLRLDAAVRVVDEPNNRVELRYTSRSDRTELQTGGRPSWTAAEIQPLLPQLDALYINFTSGFEMELEEVERLRLSFPGPIYADLHSIFLGREPDGRRTYRPLPHWERWLAAFDAVQLNADELRTLAGGDVEPEEFVAREMIGRTRLVALTLGDQGAACFLRERLPTDPLRWSESSRQGTGSGRMEAITVPPLGGPLDGDPTGCGDVWGGAFFASLLAGSTLEGAVHRGHRAAECKLSRSGASGLYGDLVRETCRIGVLRPLTFFR